MILFQTAKPYNALHKNEVAHLIAHIEKITPQTPEDEEELKAELENLRAMMYTINAEVIENNMKFFGQQLGAVQRFLFAFKNTVANFIAHEFPDQKIDEYQCFNIGILIYRQHRTMFENRLAQETAKERKAQIRKKNKNRLKTVLATHMEEIDRLYKQGYSFSKIREYLVTLPTFKKYKKNGLHPATLAKYYREYEKTL